jgi:hypothetical protein
MMTLPGGSRLIDAMSGSPALLAIIVLQLAVLFMVYEVSSTNSERQQARELALIETCGGLRP